MKRLARLSGRFSNLNKEVIIASAVGTVLVLPSNRWALRNLTRFGRYENRALKGWLTIARRNPDEEEAWLQLTRIHDKNGNHEACAEAARHVLKINPLSVEALHKRLCAGGLIDRTELVETWLQLADIDKGYANTLLKDIASHGDPDAAAFLLGRSVASNMASPGSLELVRRFRVRYVMEAYRAEMDGQPAEAAAAFWRAAQVADPAGDYMDGLHRALSLLQDSASSVDGIVGDDMKARALSIYGTDN